MQHKIYFLKTQIQIFLWQRKFILQHNQTNFFTYLHEVGLYANHKNSVKRKRALCFNYLKLIR